MAKYSSNLDIETMSLDDIISEWIVSRDEDQILEIEGNLPVNENFVQIQSHEKNLH